MPEEIYSKQRQNNQKGNHMISSMLVTAKLPTF